TLSRKGANSPTRARKLRSTGTKAKAGVSNTPNSPSELKKQLEARTCELAEVRGHLSEALEQQTATYSLVDELMSRAFLCMPNMAHKDRIGSCEPVSAPKSLLTGKLTGNFAESGPLLRFRRPVSE